MATPQSHLLPRHRTPPCIRPSHLATESATLIGSQLELFYGQSKSSNDTRRMVFVFVPNVCEMIQEPFPPNEIR